MYSGMTRVVLDAVALLDLANLVGHDCRESGREHLCLELVEFGLSDRSTVE